MDVPPEINYCPGQVYGVVEVHFDLCWWRGGSLGVNMGGEGITHATLHRVEAEGPYRPEGRGQDVTNDRQIIMTLMDVLPPPYFSGKSAEFWYVMLRWNCPEGMRAILVLVIFLTSSTNV
jgi:hypothetical protein